MVHEEQIQTNLYLLEGLNPFHQSAEAGGSPVFVINIKNIYISEKKMYIPSFESNLPVMFNVPSRV